MAIDLPYKFQNLDTSQMEDAKDSSGDKIGKVVPASYLDANFTALANAIEEQLTALANAIEEQLTALANNADTTDGFHASQTPAPNVIVPLNASGILDLSATYVKSHVYTFRRVDLTNATSDYMLQVGEEAYISFSNTTSVPLRIATQDGTIYEVIVTDGWGYNSLLPNNSSYSGQFGNARILIHWNGSQIVSGYGGGMSGDYFEMYFGMKRFLIFNDLTNKRIVGQYSDWYSLHVGNFVSWWKDATTPWTSLGTMTFESPSSGIILVRRLK